GPGPAFAQPPTPAAPAQPQNDPAAILRAAETDPADRDAAADRLVAQSAHASKAGQVVALLRDPTLPADARAALLNAIARTWSVPEPLHEPLLELAATVDPAALPTYLPAIAALRTPAAARRLIDYRDPAQPQAVRAAAVSALARMTGRGDLGDDTAQWNAWFERARALPPAEWSDLLAEGVWRRSARLEADRRALTERLTDGYRRLYLALPATPGDERSRLLAQMLRGPRAELRDLGRAIASRSEE